jgi:hypothetical protein
LKNQRIDEQWIMILIEERKMNLINLLKIFSKKVGKKRK